MTGSLLSIVDLVVRFGDDAPVVDNISLEVTPGEVVALVGESGSGKSLTARTILGLLPRGASATGTVRLGNTNVVDADDAELRAVRGTRVAMVFQEPQTALDPVRRIGAQIADALRAHGSDNRTSGLRPARIDRKSARARAIELLKLVEIPDPELRVDWYPHQLSGGQKQRVVIALALSGEPELLVADEPTTALDVTVQAEILNLLRRIRQTSGTAILLITHNMGVVADIADRVVVLRAGRVVEEQPVVELFESPREEYTKALLSAVPQLEAQPGPDRPASDKRAALHIDDVTVIYPARAGAPAFTALENVSLTVAPGEVVGLVGESGSGKTTLGRAALGLVPAAIGTIEIAGRSFAGSIHREIREIRRTVALVHQDPAASLDPRRTVGDSIREPLVVHKTASGVALRQRVSELLESVQLPKDFADRRPAELSGGQRQRVALARALSLAPALLVADEPTSALDVSVQAAVLDLFADLREQYGFACVFISHDLAVVDRVADRVAVLRHGVVVETGSTDKVFGSPREEYTKQLLDALPLPNPRAQRERRQPVSSAS